MNSPTGAKSTLVLDETGFQQLLAAAYVLQQHNDTLAIKNPRLDSAWIFSQIAEAQTLVRGGSLNFATGINVIAERLRALLAAAGVSICLVTDGYLVCMAESGTSATVPGGSIAANSAVATERLKNGKPFHSSDSQKDVRLDFVLCRQQGIRALLAVPIENSGEVAGLVEVRWSEPDAFHECDARGCELMSDLVPELLQREIAKSEDSNPALPAIADPEIADPETSGLAGTDDAIVEDNLQLSPVNESTSSLEVENISYPVAAGPSPELATSCRVCGRPFGKGETFCGNCSLPRLAASPAEGLQSKWASMWFMQQARSNLRETSSPAETSPAPQGRKREPLWPTDLAAEQGNVVPLAQSARQIQPVFIRRSKAANIGTSSVQHQSNPVLKWTRPQDERSGAPTDAAATELSRGRLNPRQVFQSLVDRVGVSRRKATLAIAGSVLVIGFSVWGLWPAHRASPNQLSWFDSLLVEMGVAEPPARAPGYAGSPNVRVWVDIHTALYYCPGSALYGKTKGGRFTSQRAAQQDAFEPASRVACE
ncbi:MAG TPA: GAF domain-containing protein [Terriglobales bacterium]